MYKSLLIFLLISGFALSAMAQAPAINPNAKETKKDSANFKRDSVTSKPFKPKVIPLSKEKTYHPDSNHSPHKAVMHSLMVPGWGQLYNHQWWKVPIIYAGLGLLADAIIFNQKNYAPNLVVAHYYEQGQTLTSLPTTAKDYALFKTYQDYQVPQATVYSLVDAYRRDRDLSILGFLAGWGIQMVDAYIDAKFQHSYTMDSDFSFKVEPTIINQQQTTFASNFGGTVAGLKLTVTLR